VARVMTRLFRRLPIRQKLVAMIVGTSAVVLLLASIGYLVSDYYQTRRALETDLAAQADLILANTASALIFEDQRVAQENLDTLSTKRNIRLACLYQSWDELLAEYRHPDERAPCPPAPEEGSTSMGIDRLEHASIGTLQGAAVGSLILRSDLVAIASRMRIQLGIVGLLLVLSLAVAVALSSVLQTIVSNPVAALARTASQVSARGDYSLRATRTTDDELGVLVDSFNRMLERIEQRESDLSQANEDLRKEVVERRRAEGERAELLVREREANRLKDEFLATLSHELRTPLNAILGWTKLLRAGAVPPAAAERALEKIERNAQVQARLIEDLLEISRIVSGKLRLEFRPLDLVAVCVAATDSIRPTAEARGIQIRPEFHPGTLATAGDPERLQQVVWNLLSNAVKFTPAGGLVTMTLRREGEVDEIVVTDTGIGIEAEFLPNVFETFRQADASTTRTHGGLGLGLSIVKQLVELHAGEVTAESPGAGQGATFSVRLPVRSLDRRRAEDNLLSPPEHMDGRLSGYEILVVDDDADTRELLVSTIQQAGGHVRGAASVDEALTLSLERIPEAIVSDIAMPDADGYMFVQRLSKELGERMPRVRVALSAFAAPGDQDRSLAAGFQRHLTKPVDPGVLVRVLEHMLNDEAGALS